MVRLIYPGAVAARVEDRNRRMLRARDAMDRDFAAPLDVAGLARVAHVSPSHFNREFRATFGETPHRYLQRRRIERAMEMLRDTERPVGEICLEVGFTSLGTFGRTFRAVVGEAPTRYRDRHPRLSAAAARPPACWAMAATRPASRPPRPEAPGPGRPSTSRPPRREKGGFGEAPAAGAG